MKLIQLMLHTKKHQNKLIHIGKPIELDEDSLFDRLNHLKDEAYQETNDIRTLIKEIVPTYHPKES